MPSCKPEEQFSCPTRHRPAGCRAVVAVAMLIGASMIVAELYYATNTNISPSRLRNGDMWSQQGRTEHFAKPVAVLGAPWTASQGSRQPPVRFPKIYVYDIPKAVTMVARERLCFGGATADWADALRQANLPVPKAVGFGMFDMEYVMWQILKKHPQRVLDPNEADFFYVPSFPVCLYHAKMAQIGAGSAWQFASRYLSIVLEEVRQCGPFFDQSQQANHIFPSTLGLGRFNISGAGDKYITLQSAGFLNRPGKEIVIPPRSNPAYLKFWRETQFNRSMADVEADFVTGSRGSLLWGFGGHYLMDLPRYSFGVRQALKLKYDAAQQQRDRVFMGDTVEFDNFVLKKNVTFCACLPGWAKWTPRPVLGVLANCIPVVLEDGNSLPFAASLQWDKFSIRLTEQDAANLTEILAAVSEEQIKAYQREMLKVAPLFVWNADYSHAPGQVGDALLAELAQLPYVSGLRASALPGGAPEALNLPKGAY